MSEIPFWLIRRQKCRISIVLGGSIILHIAGTKIIESVPDGQWFVGRVSKGGQAFPSLGAAISALQNLGVIKKCL